MSAYETKKTANDALNTANDALPKTTDVVTVGAPGVGMSNARELVAGSGVSLSTATPGQISISAPGAIYANPQNAGARGIFFGVSATTS